MALAPDKLSSFNILKAGIERSVKSELLKRIIDEQVEQLIKRLEIELTPIIQAVTFDHIENFTDFRQFRDEVRVMISVDGDVFETDEDK